MTSRSRWPSSRVAESPRLKGTLAPSDTADNGWPRGPLEVKRFIFLFAMLLQKIYSLRRPKLVSAMFRAISLCFLINVSKNRSPICKVALSFLDYG